MAWNLIEYRAVYNEDVSMHDVLGIYQTARQLGFCRSEKMLCSAYVVP